MNKTLAVVLLSVLCGAASPAYGLSLFGKKDEEEQAVKQIQIRFPVDVQVKNAELKTMIEDYLPLIKQQKEDDTIDAEQMEFLAEEAPEQVQTMLRTKGYFNAKVDVAKAGQGYVVRIDEGAPTKVDNVSVAILGDILQDPELATYYRGAMENWALPVESQFTQSDWSSSKTAVLAAVKRKKYPLATFSNTEASVNPKTQTADLSVNVDSKQPIYFGDFQIEGTKRYPESVVRGLAQFQEGSPYDLDKLLDYQQALEQDAHYSGASVQADFDNLQGDRVPVKVSVTEAKRQKLELGVRYDSEYGLGGRVAYDYYDLFGRGYTGSVVADGDRYESTVAVGISQPRNTDGHYWTSSLSHNRSTTQRLEKNATTAGLWYARDRNNIEARVGVEYLSESASIPATNTELGRSHATMLTASWKKQDMQTTLRPENGYYLDGKIGTTLGKLLSSSSMQYINLRGGYFYTPENKKIGTFIARGRVGFVNAGNFDEVPQSLMFRTGGATSVRGYELDSIGRQVPAAVLPDRALATLSLEYQYPINRSFSAAIFQDMGGVSHNFQDMKIQQGTGVGVRWFSPLAPFSFDVAYGHTDKKLRWHISLGTRF
ncbi:MAG: autotransporter assembly complex family protein [Neisseria sp.]|nr:autotransporter assembly complex family protein [Neisseria sp.]